MSCQHSKMLFETKEKADRFISFNRDEILMETSKAPVRSYYCRLCCGWHVTSNPSEEDAQVMDERDQVKARRIEKRMRDKENATAVREAGADAVTKQFDEVRSLLQAADLIKADKLLRRIMYGLYAARRHYPNWQSAQKLIQRGQELQNIVRDLNDLSASPKQIGAILAKVTELDIKEGISQLAPAVQLHVRFTKRLDAINEKIRQGNGADAACELLAIKDEILSITGYRAQYLKKNLSSIYHSLMMKMLDTIDKDTISEQNTSAYIGAVIMLADNAMKAQEQGDGKKCRAYINDALPILNHLNANPEVNGLRERLLYLDSYSLKEQTASMKPKAVSDMTIEEFEQYASGLKEAVKREKKKHAIQLYPEMTIRRAFEIWSLARSPLSRSYLDELAGQYDLNLPEDFNKWYGLKGHSFDLEYASITLYPVRATLEDGTIGWIFRLIGNPGDPVALALYCLRLQRMEVLFYLEDPQYVMKGLGYWIRSWRHEFKKVAREKKEAIN